MLVAAELVVDAELVAEFAPVVVAAAAVVDAYVGGYFVHWNYVLFDTDHLDIVDVKIVVDLVVYLVNIVVVDIVVC